MPKISVHGGPTNERAEPGDPGYVEPVEQVADAPAAEPAEAAPVEKPKRARKPRGQAKEPAGDAVAVLSVVAEAEVTRS